MTGSHICQARMTGESLATMTPALVVLRTRKPVPAV